MTPAERSARFRAVVARVQRITRRAWKWAWCSWAHPHCHPAVWADRASREGRAWHCDRCHQCSEAIDVLMNGAPRPFGGWL